MGTESDKSSNEYILSDVSFSYGKRKILDNIGFSMESGKCYALLGANGCGKSTLMTILAGSRKAASGTLSFPDGTVCNLKSSGRSSLIGYVPQENPLINTLNGYDNLLLWYKGSGSELKKTIKSDLIQMLGIDSYLKRTVSKLSGGMKRRLSIAIGLINSPKILLLDEPSAALDLPCKQDIAKYLDEYNKKGGTILLTTHEEAELSLCDRYMILKGGNITEHEPGMPVDKLISLF